MTTTPAKDNEASKPGRYSYMDLLSEWQLVNRSFDWIKDAACRGVDSEIFFAEEGNWHAKHAEAIELCSKCTVYKDCLRFATENNIGYGIWGGLTPKQRKRSRLEIINDLERE